MRRVNFAPSSAPGIPESSCDRILETWTLNFRALRIRNNQALEAPRTPITYSLSEIKYFASKQIDISFKY